MLLETVAGSELHCSGSTPTVSNRISGLQFTLSDQTLHEFWMHVQDLCIHKKVSCEYTSFPHVDLFLEHLLRLHNQCEQFVTLKSICFLSSTLTFHLAKSKWSSTANRKPPPMTTLSTLSTHNTTQHVAESEVMPSFSAVLYFKFWIDWLAPLTYLTNVFVCRC